MAYIINNTRGNLVATVADGTVDSTTIPVTLVGRGVTNYGLIENENYVYLLENFCAPAAPPNAIQGQLWFNSDTNTLLVRNMANTWAAVASESYVQDQKISPAFSGIPTAPTASVGTNTTQLATTAFVGTAISTFAGGVGNVYAPINSPAFTGLPTAPTAANTDNSTQIATTAFVQAQKNNIALTGLPTAPTAANTDNSTQIATTAFVQAQKNNTVLTGTPIAPSPLSFDNSTRLATTEFVQAQKANIALTGFPTAPTQTVDDNSTRIATTAFVQNQKANIALTGVPTAPTPVTGTSSNQIATTQYVVNTLNPSNGFLGTMSLQNANNVAIINGTIANLAAPLNINSGGTGATDAATARQNLGIPLFPLDITNGGTGATNAAQARINLGIGNIPTSFVPGTIATQNANAVAITGGSITGITDIAIADGGTGASTATQARINLGLGNLATQSDNAVLITGGQIYGLNPALPIASGGTGATSAAGARTALGLQSGAITNVGTLATQNANAVTITGGNVSGVTVSSLASPLAISSGGTGAATAADARTALGLLSGATTAVGTLATQNANAVAITGGTITGVVLGIPSGGTGATSAAGARTALGLQSGATTTVGTMATQNANAVAITGGTITGVGGFIPIGGIIMWSGSVANIPGGYALCNGTNGTPDLRDRFVIGAGLSYAVGALGGSKDAVVVSHTHAVVDPGHTHSYQRRVAITNGEFRNDLMAGYNLENATTGNSVTGISISSSGTSGTNANLPPYYALCYIMRTS